MDWYVMYYNILEAVWYMIDELLQTYPSDFAYVKGFGKLLNIGLHLLTDMYF